MVVKGGRCSGGSTPAGGDSLVDGGCELNLDSGRWSVMAIADGDGGWM